jgi:nitrate/nitrite transport system permease protein
MTAQTNQNPLGKFNIRLPAFNMSLLAAIGLPMLVIAFFLMIWSALAPQVNTSLGTFPGPGQAWEQAQVLLQEHHEEREKEQAFYQRQEERNAARAEQDPTYNPKVRAYTGKPTFIDQIGTSLVTVLIGFALASLVAIPLGIFLGLSERVNLTFDPIIQIFKPISPLAWLPLVTMVVSAVYVSDDPMFEKSFITSVITVCLCSLWPTLINTAVGVANIDKDLMNVSHVLRLSTLTHIRKIVIPASIPMMFTGLRLSIGIAWMVLIAAEMLAQNPGLGKFVWDEFQNGSSNSLSRIIVAVLTIGFVGFCLDRVMLLIQQKVNWDKNTQVR